MSYEPVAANYMHEKNSIFEWNRVMLLNVLGRPARSDIYMEYKYYLPYEDPASVTLPAASRDQDNPKTADAGRKLWVPGMRPADTNIFAVTEQLWILMHYRPLLASTPIIINKELNRLMCFDPHLNVSTDSLFQIGARFGINSIDPQLWWATIGMMGTNQDPCKAKGCCIASTWQLTCPVCEYDTEICICELTDTPVHKTQKPKGFMLSLSQLVSAASALRGDA